MKDLFGTVEFRNHDATTREVFLEPGCETFDVPGGADVILEFAYSPSRGFAIEFWDGKASDFGNEKPITIDMYTVEPVRAMIDGREIEV